MSVGKQKLHPSLLLGAKVFLGLVVAAGLIWLTIAIERGAPNRGRRIDSGHAFHEFLDRHEKADALLAALKKNPAASEAERRATLDRCRRLIDEIEPNAYEECDKRLAGAIIAYKTIRLEQLEQAATAPGSDGEKKPSKRHDPVQSARHKVFNEMRRVKRTLGGGKAG